MKGMKRAERLIDALIVTVELEACAQECNGPSEWEATKIARIKARTALVRHIRALRARERYLTAREPCERVP